MKLTLESQAVEVALADPRFPLARVWKGVTDDGREIMALIACVDSRREAEQTRLAAELADLPTDLYLNARQAEYLFGQRRVA